jgi:hypothetical protein
MTARDFRTIALGLPGASEAAHHGHPDFRVAGQIFATLGYPRPSWGTVRLTLDQQAMFVRAQPAAFRPVPGAWGRAGYTNVRLRVARTDTVREALVMAWRNRVPQRLGGRVV